MKQMIVPSILTRVYTRLIHFAARLWKPFLLGFVGFHLLVAAWSVLQGDIKFHTDIARDFLLLYEIEVKK